MAFAAPRRLVALSVTCTSTNATNRPHPFPATSIYTIIYIYIHIYIYIDDREYPHTITACPYPPALAPRCSALASGVGGRLCGCDITMRAACHAYRHAQPIAQVDACACRGGCAWLITHRWGPCPLGWLVRSGDTTSMGLHVVVRSGCARCYNIGGKPSPISAGSFRAAKSAAWRPVPYVGAVLGR